MPNPKPTTPKKVTLEYPFKRGETEVSTVDIRRPASGELRGLNLSDVLNLNVDAMTKLIPRITPLMDEEVKQLDPVDLVQICSEIGDFFVPKSALTDGSLNS